MYSNLLMLSEDSNLWISDARDFLTKTDSFIDNESQIPFIEFANTSGNIAVKVY